MSSMVCVVDSESGWPPPLMVAARIIPNYSQAATNSTRHEDGSKSRLFQSFNFLTIRGG